MTRRMAARAVTSFLPASKNEVLDWISSLVKNAMVSGYDCNSLQAVFDQITACFKNLVIRGPFFDDDVSQLQLILKDSFLLFSRTTKPALLLQSAICFIGDVCYHVSLESPFFVRTIVILLDCLLEPSDDIGRQTLRATCAKYLLRIIIKRRDLFLEELSIEFSGFIKSLMNDRDIDVRNSVFECLDMAKILFLRFHLHTII